MKMEAAPFVPAPGRRSQAKGPPCDAGASDAAASTASHPNVRDDRDTPLVEGMRQRQLTADLGRMKTGMFFVGGLDRPNQLDLAG
jgi:hypothetical protein